MLSQRLTEEINLQIKYEFFSAQLYLSMASYCADNDLPGFENWFIMQAEEERFHAMKFYNYLNSRGAKAIITGFDDPKVDFEDLMDCFKFGLEHEKFVTSRMYHLMDISQEEKEYASISMLNWFIDEQVEEEESFSNIIAQLKFMGTGSDVVYRLDRELAARAFVPPVE
ncbi:ferritin [Alkalibaculum sp. M08DMB]|uniref:Ferritin n=1 Tax=Alkalibaculum sporogenes TaxID=2655001 RepID=A0A6A7K617_9FIRM|nr:ferritin [Alkalibaculum sporogenes]MPW24888.1 ferritin [Alkalibaculum sporogenes]